MSAKVKDFKSLRFPEELGTNEVPAWVRFVPMEMKYGGQLYNGSGAMSVGEAKGYAKKTSKNGIGSFTEQLQNAVGGLVDSLANDAVSALESFGDSLKVGNLLSKNKTIGKFISGTARIGDIEISAGLKTAPDELNRSGSINLYAPEEGYASNNSADYSAQDFGSGVKDLASVVDGSAKSANDTAAAIGRYAVSEAVGYFKNIGNVKEALAFSKGVVQNNYSFQLFNGIQHRSYEYAFKFVPRNSKDSLVIKEICDMFLYYMLPSRGTDANSLVHYYEIPAQWEISYMRDGNKNPYINQPKNCFLTACNVKYNGGEVGNAQYSDGAPMVVELALNFVEIEPLFRLTEPGQESVNDEFTKQLKTSADSAGGK